MEDTVKKADVKVGEEYMAKINGARAVVRVLSVHEDYEGKTYFGVARPSALGRTFRRTAAELHLKVERKAGSLRDAPGIIGLLANSGTVEQRDAYLKRDVAPAPASSAVINFAACTVQELVDLAKHGHDEQVRHAAIDHLALRVPPDVA